MRRRSRGLALPVLMGGGGIPEINIACPTITPTVGASIWDAAAAVFTSGTYAWVQYGNNILENEGNTLKITYVDNTTGAQVSLNNAADLSADLTPGASYQLSLDLKVGQGAVSPLVGDGIVYPNYTQGPTADFVTGKFCFRAHHATNCFLRIANMAAGEYAWVDNLALSPITDMTTLLGTLGHQAGTYICNPTVAALSAAGLLVAYKDASNFLWMAVDRGTGHARLFKVVAGTWTSVISGAITYANGGELKLIIDGTDCSLYYASTQVGATTAVAQLASMGNGVYGWNNKAGNEVGTVTTSPLV